MENPMRVLAWLLVAVVLGYLACGTSAQDVDGSRDGSLSGSLSLSASDSIGIEDKNPCSFRGEFLEHKEARRLDPCTLCTCSNGTTTCDIESCPPEPGCRPREIVIIPELCCPQCPYKMFVENVNNLYEETFSFAEGDSKKIKFELDVEIDRKLTSRMVRGENLWKLSAWISRNEDGSGRRYSRNDNVFSDEHAAQAYSKPEYPPWQWSKLKYTVNFRGGSCDDYKYFCVKFDQSDNPQPTYDLDFTFQPVDNEVERLIDCVPLGECRGLTAVDLDFELREREPPSYGEETGIGLDVDVSFTRKSADRRGEGSWRFALFGSGNRDGSGQRFREASQVLREGQQATSKRGTNLVINNINRDFEIGSIGCMEDIPYVCVEFAQGDDPDPPFTMVIETPTNTLIKCKEQECYAKAIFSDLVPDLTGDFPSLEGRMNIIRLNLDAITDKEESTSVSGDALWTLGTYFNARANGKGPRINEISQILDLSKQSTDLVQDENLEFAALEFETDFTRVVCDDIPFICFELSKNDAASIPYIFGTNPVKDPFVKCVDFTEYCKGIKAVDLDFDLEERDPPVYGERTGISLDVDVSFTRQSGDVDGEKLWRAGVFGSANIDGSGPRFGEIRKILDEGSVGEGKSKTGNNLVFTGLERNFEIGTIGCTEVQYVCVEFAQIDDPNPPFRMVIDTPTNTLIECKERECSARAIFSSLVPELTGDFPAIEGKTNTIRLNLDAITNKDESTVVPGDSLWTLGTYFSARPNGRGRRIQEISQILDQSQQDIDLIRDQNLEFSALDFETDLTGVVCKDIPYICFELSKNDAASLDYIFGTSPVLDPFVECVDFSKYCKGVIYNGIIWDREIPDHTPGRPVAVTINSEIQVDPVSRPLSGNGLYEMGVFVASNNDGTGRLTPSFNQTLTPNQASTRLPAGGPLTINGIRTPPFVVERLGCGEFKYLCVEFRKGRSARPDYKAEFTQAAVESGSAVEGVIFEDNQLISCREEKCAGAIFSELVPELTGDFPVIEGKTNTITLNLEAVTDKEQSTAVLGDSLWTLGIYFNSRSDGRGSRINEISQILDLSQQSIDLFQDENLEFSALDFDTDLTGVVCADIPFICFELQKNDAASIPYIFGTNPVQDPFVKCMDFSEYCKGIEAVDLDFDLEEREHPRYGERTGVSVDLDVSFTPQSADLDGRKLWRAGLFGSDNIDGSGERFGEIRKILDEGSVGEGKPKEGTNLVFSGLDRNFEIGSIGCTDEGVQYVCVEFAQIDDPNPPFRMVIDTPTNTLIKCKEHECSARAIFSELVPELTGDFPAIEGKTNTIRLNLEAVTDKEQSTSVSGDTLWTLRAYFNSRSDDRGSRINEISQILDLSQQSTVLVQDENLEFSALDFDTDLTEVVCADITFICFELQKNDAASIPYIFGTNPVQDPFVKCMDFSEYCKGIEAVDLDFNLEEREPPRYGERTGVSVDLDVSFTPQSADLDGRKLWRAALFGSNNIDGSGQRFGEIRKILDEGSIGEGKPKEGPNLVFSGLDRNFEIGSIGCTEEDVQYVCVEFEQADDPNPPFRMVIDTPTNTLIKCKEHDCSSSIEAVELDFDLEEREPPRYGERTGVSVDLDVSFTPQSADLDGRKLWRAGLFGSNNIDGSGQRFGEIRKILDEGSIGEGKPKEGPNLVFSGLDRNFEIGSIGCTEEDIQYVCVEFAQIDDPNPPFRMVIDTPTNTLIKCKEHECAARAIFSDLVPELTGDFPAIEGKTNTIRLKLEAVTDKEQSTTVLGDSLWTLGIYFNSRSDGRGSRINEISQILDQSQQGIDLLQDENLELSALDFDTDLTGVVCEDIPFICFELQKNDAASIPYIFGTNPVQDPFVKCMDFSEYCQGIEAVDLDFDLEEREPPRYGERTGVSVDLDVNFTPQSADLDGRKLWRAGLFGSNNIDGSGQRFGEIRKILDEGSVGEGKPKEGTNLLFSGLDRNFEIGTIGCAEEDVQYVCVEFAQIDDPNPPFRMVIDTPTNTLIKCKEHECSARAIFSDLVPELTGDFPAIEGKTNTIRLNLEAVTDKEQSTAVLGDSLWTLGIYFNSRSDGRGSRINEISQILDQSQQGIDLLQDENLELSALDFDTDLTGVVCEDIPFICFELQKNDAASIPYIFGTNPVQDPFVKCMDFSEYCQGIEAVDLDFDLEEREPPRYGERTGVSVDLDVSFTPQSADLDGRKLWRAGLFGSNNIDGSGQRFGEIRKILDEGSVGEGKPKEGTNLIFSGLDRNFEIGTIGCAEEDVQYVCVEFAQIDDPNPPFRMVIDTPTNTLIKCKEHECSARAIFSDLVPELTGDFPAIEGKTNTIRLNLEAVTDKEQSTAVLGDSLWTLGIYFNSRSDGRGSRINEISQILDQSQQGIDLVQDENLELSALDFDTDLTGVVCADIPFICFELQKNDAASIPYIFGTNPVQDPFVKCMDFSEYCQGIEAVDLDFDLEEREPPRYGERTGVIVDLDVSFTPQSADLDGRKLWRAGLFGSENIDGSGQRFGEIRKILDEGSVGEGKPKTGTNLVFSGLYRNFEIGSIGCTDEDVQYVCVEFAQIDDPNPPFRMVIDTPTNTLIKCKEHECSARAIFSELVPELTGDFPAIEGKTNTIRLNLEAVTDKEQSTSISGDTLWTLRAYFNSRSDGRGSRINEISQILDLSQQSTDLIQDENLEFSALDFETDLTEVVCADIPFICFELQKNDAASIPYIFGTNPVQDPFVKCMDFSEYCQGIEAVDLDFDLEEREPPRYGERTGVIVDLDVSFTPQSADLDGRKLWRAGLFGSENIDGSGQRFGEIRKILDEGSVGEGKPKTGTNLVFSGLYRNFEIGSIGCTDEDVQYVCVEFAQIDDPNPPFRMVIDTPTNTLIKCKEHECSARAIFSELVPELTGDFPAIEGKTNTIRLNLEAVTDKEQSTSISGDTLWTLRAYFNSRSDGRGSRINEISQILDLSQQSTDLIQDENLEFSALDFETDLTEVVCADIPFICFELQKNDAASIPYIFGTNPVQDPFVKCMDFSEYCQGIKAVDLDFVLEETEPLLYGKRTGISLDLNVSFTPQSADMIGRKLWRAGLFGSGNIDGSGPRFREIRKILDEGSVGEGKPKTGTNLVFSGVDRNFEIGSIGCVEGVQYVCVEFAQIDDPDPPFGMVIDTPTNSLIKCKEQECSARAIFSEMLPELTGDFPVIEGETNTIRLNLEAVTDKEQSTAVLGDSLWTLGAYFSARSNGRGSRIKEISQILDLSQQGIDLVRDENLEFSALDFQADLTGVVCKEIPYICFELQKNDAASVGYVFGTNPIQDPFVECLPFSGHCNATSCENDDSCDCPPGYTGADCKKPECLPQGCQNGGKCIRPNYCRCPPAYRGRRCQKDYCRERCRNGGTCIGPDTCKCPRGFMGAFCQKTFNCPRGCRSDEICVGFNVCEPISTTGDRRKGGGLPGDKNCFPVMSFSQGIQTTYVKPVIGRVEVPCGKCGSQRCTIQRLEYTIAYRTVYRTAYRCGD